MHACKPLLLRVNVKTFCQVVAITTYIYIHMHGSPPCMHAWTENQLSVNSLFKILLLQLLKTCSNTVMYSINNKALEP